MQSILRRNVTYWVASLGIILSVTMMLGYYQGQFPAIGSIEGNRADLSNPTITLREPGDTQECLPNVAKTFDIGGEGLAPNEQQELKPCTVINSGSTTLELYMHVGSTTPGCTLVTLTAQTDNPSTPFVQSGDSMAAWSTENHGVFPVAPLDPGQEVTFSYGLLASDFGPGDRGESCDYTVYVQGL